jgi:hypothetical protein
MDEGAWMKNIKWMKILDKNLSNPSKNDKFGHQGINRVFTKNLKS